MITISGRTSTAEWKRLRAKAIRRAQRNGQEECPCGRRLTYDQHGLPSSPEADHIIPYIRGGADHLDNLQVLCRTCNRRKGPRTEYSIPKPQRLTPALAVTW